MVKLQTSSDVMNIRIDALTTDPAYQRQLDERRAEVIARDFDPMRFGTVCVSKRDDRSLVIIDGQTRCAGARIAGFGNLSVRCEVFSGLTLKDEAALFLKLNNGRTAVRSLDKYKAALVAEEPWATEIHTILKRYKIRACKSVSPRRLGAIDAAKSVHLREHNLDRVLGILMSWAPDDSASLAGQLLKSMAYFLSMYPEASDKHLIERLDSKSPDSVLNAIKREKDRDVSIKLQEAACVIILQHYNKRMRVKLEPYSRRKSRKPRGTAAVVQPVMTSFV